MIESLMQNLKTYLLDYLKLILVTIIVIITYDKISFKANHHLYTNGTQSVYEVELLLIILISTVFYFPKLKNKILKYIFPSIPIIGLYISFDVFYNFLLRGPKISDFENLINIYDFYPVMFFEILIFIFCILSSMYYLISKVKKTYTLKKYRMTIFSRLIILSAFIVFLQTGIFKTYHQKLFEFVTWSHESTIRNNGRMSSFIFYSNLEQTNKKLLKIKNNINISNVLYKEPLVDKRNIYYVILESFINPNYIKDVVYNTNPLSPKLTKYLPNGKFSKIISPIYGGGTPQAEFELLTGVKAFSKINTIEFNALTGGKIDAFLLQFKKNGYNTAITVATTSGYFNSTDAYHSLGFEDIVFLEEYEKFKKNKYDKRIFDGDLFDYNLKFIKNYLKKSKKPLFNYILGVYGHIPYDRNKQDRPDLITLKNIQNNSIQNIANQFYYRTKALAAYIENILILDPDAIILVSSDHIPAILSNTIKYKYTKYTNIALLLNRGKPVNISMKNQYQIPWIIWDILSKKTAKRDNNKNILEKIYFKALYEGIK